MLRMRIIKSKFTSISIRKRFKMPEEKVSASALVEDFIGFTFNAFRRWGRNIEKTRILFSKPDL